MKLSILIPSLPESEDYLKRLRNILDPQVSRFDGVEIVVNKEPRGMPTGTKRNILIQQSAGEYFSFIDVDDLPPAYYVDELMKAIEQVPDVITFIGFMTTDMMNRRDFTIKLGSPYEERNGHYYRFPNHLCCFKKELVQHIKFPDIWVQEDYQWARMVNERRLLKKEIHIGKIMYHYDYRNKKPNERFRV